MKLLMEVQLVYTKAVWLLLMQPLKATLPSQVGLFRLSVTTMKLDITKYLSVDLREIKQLLKGGDIYYNFRRPELEQNEYSHNSASYSPDIASYPVRVAQVGSIDENIVLRSVGSGRYLDESPASSDQVAINLVLVDYDDQAVILSDSIQVTISSITPNTSTLGNNVSKRVNQTLVFDSIGFVAYPGAQNVKFKASSKVIDKSKTKHLNLPTDDTITVSFRFCQPGEKIYDTTR